MSNTTHPSPPPPEYSDQPQPVAAGETPKPERLLSLDAYRGAIMLLMASSGLGLATAATFHPNNALWKFLAEQSDHATWVGCHLWDLIQPAFMFMVGVALPWSVANRRARGRAFGAMFRHATGRSLLLVLLAVFLNSPGSRQTAWSFNNVLAQIGLGYRRKSTPVAPSISSGTG
jgi:heparan-alpha-glucosaminide N-acetyltransferase